MPPTPPWANSLTTVAPGFITVRQPRAHIAARSLCRVGLVMWHERAWLRCSSAAVHVSISAFLGSLHPSCKPIRLLTMLSAPPPSIFTPASSFPYWFLKPLPHVLLFLLHCTHTRSSSFLMLLLLLRNTTLQRVNITQRLLLLWNTDE